jgi:hypothetical protein
VSELGNGGKKRPPFQVEPTDLVDEIMARGHITPWELFKIVSWKSAKGVAWLSLNSEEEIEDVTRETVDALKEWQGPQDVISAKMTFEDWDSGQADVAQILGADKSRTKGGNSTGLLRLHGVGYPVATAILALLKPKIFPVMDRWAVVTIFEEGSSRKQWQRSAVYRAYAERLVNPDCPALERFTTLRERDKAAMNASMAPTDNGQLVDGYEKISLPKKL